MISISGIVKHVGIVVIFLCVSLFASWGDFYTICEEHYRGTSIVLVCDIGFQIQNILVFIANGYLFVISLMLVFLGIIFLAIIFMFCFIDLQYHGNNPGGIDEYQC